MRATLTRILQWKRPDRFPRYGIRIRVGRVERSGAQQPNPASPLSGFDDGAVSTQPIATPGREPKYNL